MDGWTTICITMLQEALVDNPDQTDDRGATEKHTRTHGYNYMVPCREGHVTVVYSSIPS